MSRATPAIASTDWAMIERRALLIGAAGCVVCGASAIFSWQHFLRAYLVAWNFWAGISLGAMALLMIQYLTGGAWGLLLRRFLEAAAGNIPGGGGSRGMPARGVLLYGRHRGVY